MFSACIGAANARAGLFTRNIPFKLRSHQANSELRNATNMKGNKRAFGFREPDHIQIHSNISITDGTYFTFNFVLTHKKKVRTAVLTDQRSRVL